MNDKIKPRFKLRLLHDITDIYDDNIDAVVDLNDGKSFAIAFFTKKNIFSLCEKWKEVEKAYGCPGECLNGSYFWEIDSVIVEKLEYPLLEQVVADMLEQDEHVFEKHFTRMTDENEEI